MYYLIYVEGRQMVQVDDYFKYNIACQPAIATAMLAGFKWRETCTVINGEDITRLDITKD